MRYKLILFLLIAALLASGGRVKLIKQDVRTAHNLSEHLIAHWTMDDNTADTNVIDSSGNGYHGTAQQDTCDVNATGKIGGALSFNGTSDYINTNNTFQSVFQDDFSINLWIKPTDGKPSEIQYLLFNADGPYGWLALTLRPDGKLSFVYNVDNELPVISSTTDVLFTDGQQGWSMVTITLEQGAGDITGKVYFNGALSATSASADLMSNFITTVDLFIGVEYYYGEFSNWFNGSIDDVMIFNKALTQAEIDYLYNEGEGR